MGIAWSSPGLLRPLTGRELSCSLDSRPSPLGCTRALGRSDGTLRFLCLAAALLSPQPPSLLALNEPENSLHPRVIPALALLCANAARTSQLWITTHSQALADALSESTAITEVRLAKVGGETVIV